MSRRRPWYKQAADTLALVLVGLMTLGAWIALIGSYAEGNASDVAFLVFLAGALTYWMTRLVREVRFLWGHGPAPEAKVRRSV